MFKTLQGSIIFGSHHHAADATLRHPDTGGIDSAGFTQSIAFFFEPSAEAIQKRPISEGGEPGYIFEQHDTRFQGGRKFNGFQDQISTLVAVSVPILTAERLTRRAHDQQVNRPKVADFRMNTWVHAAYVITDEPSSVVIEFEGATGDWIIVYG